MPRLSIVIPVLGDPQQLDDTLVSVLENRPVNCEILVVHNEPYADPYALADEVLFVAADRGARMADCLNLGLSASQAPIVHVLTCGVQVRPGWAGAAVRHFPNPEVAAVAAMVLSGSNPRTVVSAGLGYRAEGAAWRIGQHRNLADVDAALHRDLCGPDTLAAFYRRSALEAVGGFSPWAGDALAGIDVALALRSAGFRCTSEPECLAQVDAAAVSDQSSFAQGCDAERLFWRWASAHGWTRSLAAHAAMLLGQCVIGLWRPSMIAQLAGRACGALGAMFGRRRPKPAALAPLETPRVVALPHLTAARLHEKQHSIRAA